MAETRTVEAGSGVGSDGDGDRSEPTAQLDEEQGDSPVRLGIGPREIMDEEMNLQASPRLETALPVPLGAALSGVYGE